MYTVNTLMNAIECGEISEEMECFHGWDHFLSQHYVSPFSVDGITYRTAEHWMMSQKALIFGDDLIRRRLLGAKSPSAVKRLGRFVAGFDPKEWDRVKIGIVRRGNIQKFQQNADLRQMLLDTGNKVLVEAALHDTIWGVGLRLNDPRLHDPRQWRGGNLLGFILMDVREIFRNPKRVVKKVVKQQEVIRKVVKRIVKDA